MVSGHVMEPEVEPISILFSQHVAVPTYTLSNLCVFAYVELHIASNFILSLFYRMSSFIFGKLKTTCSVQFILTQKGHIVINETTALITQSLLNCGSTAFHTHF